MIGTVFTVSALVASLLAPLRPPPPPDDWARDSCGSGQFYPELAEITLNSSTIYGTIGCVADFPARFAVALFSEQVEMGYVFYDMLAHYPTHVPPVGVANFAVTEVQQAPPLDSAYQGMCLMSDYDVRLSCVRLAVDGAGLRVMTSLSPDDPLVAKPVKLSGGPPPNPECASCRRLSLI